MRPEAPLAAEFGRPVRRRRALPLVLAGGAVLAAAWLLLHDDVRYYRVTSGSMEPTLAVGSRVAVDADLPLRVGEVVAFRAPRGAIAVTPVCEVAGEGAGFPQPCGLATPEASATILLKRIVAGPGELVSLRDGRAVVDGITRSEPFVVPCSPASGCEFPQAVRVPPAQYFVLGDNRGVSDDSRYWGPIPAAWIVGVVVRCRALQTACAPVR